MPQRAAAAVAVAGGPVLLWSIGAELKINLDAALLNLVYLLHYGRVSERFKELVLKTSDTATYRGFESHPFRQVAKAQALKTMVAPFLFPHRKRQNWDYLPFYANYDIYLSVYLYLKDNRIYEMGQ